MDHTNLYLAIISGALLLLNDRCHEAAERLSSAVRKGDHRPDVLGALSLSLIETGSLREALETAKTALEADPDNMYSANNYALALFHSGRYSESISILRKLEEKDPGYDYTLSNLAFALFAMGRYAEAERYYSVLCDRIPGRRLPLL